MYRSDFNKLIRSKIPARMLEQKVEVNASALNSADYLAQLKQKIIEEAHEVAEAENNDELAIELADVMEDIYAIAEASNITREKIEEERLKKHEINGGFSPDCYINYIQIASDNYKVIEYPQNQKRKYVFNEGE